MAVKQKVVQNPDGSQTIYVKPDIIGIFGELVGVAGGLVAGGFVGAQMWKMIGPASSTLEKAGKLFLVGSVSTAAEHYVSEGISGVFNDISETSDWAAEKIRARSQKILAEAAGQPVQEVPAQQQETKKK